MRYLLINIVLLFLFSQTAYSRADYTLVVTSLEEFEDSHPTYPGCLYLTDTIILDVSYAGTPPNFNKGIAVLNWAYTPIMRHGSPNTYSISKRIGGTIWTTIADNITGNLYRDTIADGLCGIYIDYKIETIISVDTVTSNIAGKTFTDSHPPDKPTFDSISIIDNNYAILGWEPSVSADAWGTVIYRHDGSTWPTIDTIFGNNITFYIDSSYSACIENYQYAIAAFDSCGNVSPGTFSSPLHPVFLYDISYNLCSETNSLSWVAYINASPPLEKYEIWSIKNNVDTLLIGETISSILVYNHTGVDNATDYSYFVKAIFGDFTSTSCIKTIRTGNFIKPDSLYLTNANVLTDNNIELTLDLDLKPNTCTWEILRSDAGGGNQSLLATFTRNQVTTSPYTYLDETADGSTGYYTYSINVFDSCGAMALQSNTIKTIYLEGVQLSDNEIQLSWNALEGFDGGVDKYYIFRMLGNIMPSLPIDSTDAQTTEYTDNTSTVDPAESKISYWVQAAEGSGNNYDYQEKSNSNIISLYRETDMYLPNAFRPNGVNTIFKPVATGFGGSNYLFQIYNRWGQLIFESSDYELGWDGTYKGKPSQQGTYVYKLVYQSVFNETKQQQGTVTLIH